MRSGWSRTITWDRMPGVRHAPPGPADYVLGEVPGGVESESAEGWRNGPGMRRSEPSWKPR
jgi:hypothetical protein